MRAITLSLIVVALPVLGGCSSGDGDGGSAGTSLTCGPNELKVAGKINGQELSLTRAVTGYGFENKLTAAPGRLSATTANGSLLIEFNQLTADGQSSPARGNFTDGTLSIGNCETGDFVSTLSADANGNGVHFTLKQPLNAPFCGGSSAAGADLDGCVGFQP